MLNYLEEAAEGELALEQDGAVTALDERPSPHGHVPVRFRTQKVGYRAARGSAAHAEHGALAARPATAAAAAAARRHRGLLCYRRRLIGKLIAHD